MRDPAMPLNPTFVPTARVLDVTRLISRAGRVHTGVDRVELAYLRALVEDPVPVYPFVRSAFGYILIAPDHSADLLRKIETDTWGPADRLSKVARRIPPERRRAESDLRRMAHARCLPRRLHRMVRTHLPAGTAYLNVGHSNLTDRVLSAFAGLDNHQICVLIHDTIPVDFPNYQRHGTPERFERLLRRVAYRADLILCNSAVTERDVLRHTARWNLSPTTAVAHLGVHTTPADPVRFPSDMPTDRPYFVVLGTIEPRKNHALLLDIWDDWRASDPTTCPRLAICGPRGWNNDAVFARLDAAKGDPNSLIHEFNDLNDAQVAALLDRSNALLFPSFAEGYGLPPLEAAALGVPVICGDLAIYRELLGNIPIYANLSDRYLWQNKIAELADTGRAGQHRQAGQQERFAPPTWNAHFNVVLRMT